MFIYHKGHLSAIVLIVSTLCRQVKKYVYFDGIQGDVKGTVAVRNQTGLRAGQRSFVRIFWGLEICLRGDLNYIFLVLFVYFSTEDRARLSRLEWSWCRAVSTLV